MAYVKLKSGRELKGWKAFLIAAPLTIIFAPILLIMTILAMPMIILAEKRKI